MSMIPLKPSWSFDMEGALDFAGAHGEEVVRGILIDSQVCSLVMYDNVTSD